jgi:co-chaperonin GroES (HSP10)
MKLVPLNECVLVELTESLEYVDMLDKQYSTKTSGVVVAIADDAPLYKEKNYLVDKKVYFTDFQDGTQVDIDGKQYAFIKYSEIRGYE